jgi:hypothetical protein
MKTFKTLQLPSYNISNMYFNSNLTNHASQGAYMLLSDVCKW